MHHGHGGEALLKPRRDKKPSRLRRLVWRIEAFAAGAGLRAAGYLPLSWIGKIAGAAGDIIGGLAPARREILEENLKQALGPMDKPRIPGLIKAVRQNAVLMLLECARLGRMTRAALRETVECEPEARELLNRISAGGRGAVLMTAHIGNWEWGASWVADALARPFGIVYKPLHNPFADALLLERRQRLGLLPFSTRSKNQRELVAFLKRGGIVGILPDQDAGRRGEFIPFFGKPASTTTAFARLAVRMDLDAIFVVVHRTAPGRLRLQAALIDKPEAGLDRDEAARRMMLDYHRKLEAAIREDPEQYFWWHRRWRTQPKRKRQPAESPRS